MDDDTVDTEVLARLDGCGGKAFSHRHSALSGAFLKIVVGCLVINATLSLGADLTEEAYGLDGVLTVAGLLVKKNGISSIKDAG